MNNRIEYEKLKKQYGRGHHNLKCIDGTITGSCNCVAFCHYEEHRGFMTEKHMRVHDCNGKGCLYLFKKPEKKKQPKNIKELIKAQKNTENKAFSMACKCTESFEGLRVMNAKLEDSKCVLNYITISNEYDLVPVAIQIRESLDLEVVFIRLNYSFDNIVELIMRKDIA